MTGTRPDDAGRSQLLDEAVVEYLEAVEAGRPFDTGEWLARYPSVTAELNEFLSDQQQVKRWTDPLQNIANTLSLGGGDRSSSSENETDSSATPSVVGDYELLDEIARGGMGVVYRARQLSLNRIVALKMVLSGDLASTAELARFRTETEAFAQLDHSNIMPIYEVGDHEGRPYFSMKLIDGGNLTAQLPRFSGDGRSIARLLAVIARAVHHAHQRGILHRDLKPDNILLDSESQPYVTDFGLARSMQGDSGMTQSGVIVGTPSYMAPEQAAGSKDLTTAVDVYGLGTILYVLLSGCPPFRGETPVETVRRVLEEEPSRPRMLQPRVHRDLETICMKCLHKEPQRRYGSAEALAEDLERWLNGEPILARRSSIFERTLKRAQRNPVAAALVVVSLLAAVGLIGGVALYRQQQSRSEARLEKQATGERERDQERVAGVEEDVDKLLIDGEQLLARGQLADATQAFRGAVELAKKETSLGELTRRVQARLDEAQELQHEQTARAAAAERYRQLIDHRDDVLLQGTQYTGVNLLKTVADTLDAGQQALSLFGLTIDGGGRFDVPRHLADERAAIADQCYGVLLIVAEAAWRQNPSQLDQALRLLDQAKQLRGPTRSFYERRARYLEQSDPAVAARERDLARSIPPTSALDFFLLGEDLRRQGELRLAIDEFNKALLLDSNHFWSQYLAGICHLQLSSHTQAVTHFTACLRHETDIAAWIHQQRAIALSQLKQYEPAKADFDRAEQLAGARHDDLLYAILLGRASMLRGQGLTDSAIEDLHKAIAIKRDEYQAYLAIAKSLADSGAIETALNQVDRAIEIAGQRFSAGELEPIELALVYQHRAVLRWDDDRQSALDDIRRGLAAHPYAEGYQLVGDYLQINARQAQAALANAEQDAQAALEYAQAAQAYEASLRVKPLDPARYDSSDTYRNLAVCLLQLERYEEATRSLDAYLESGGRADAVGYQLRGLARAYLQDYTGAIQDYSQALEIKPGNPITHTYRGWVWLVMNATAEAAADFQRAIDLDPGFGDAYAGRASLRAALYPADAVLDAEKSLQLGERPRKFRPVWAAARVYARATVAMEARRGRTTYDPNEHLRYRDRALELVHEALELVPPEQAAKYWRKYFERDADFVGIRRSPEFGRLSQRYNSDRKEV